MDAMEEGTSTRIDFMGAVAAGGDRRIKMMLKFQDGIDSGIKTSHLCADVCNNNAYELDQKLYNLDQERARLTKESTNWKEKGTFFKTIGEAYKAEPIELLDRVRNNGLELTRDVLIGFMHTNNAFNASAFPLKTLRKIYLRTHDFAEIQKLKTEEKYQVLAFCQDILQLHCHDEVINNIKKAVESELVWPNFPQDQIIVNKNHDDDETLAGLIGLYFGCLPEHTMNEWQLVRSDCGTRR